MDQLQRDGRRLAGMVGFAFGVLLHVVVGFFVFSSGLIAPLWAVVVLIGLWFVGASLLWTWRASPVRTLLIPVVMAAIWWAAISAGGTWLGWTA